MFYYALFSKSQKRYCAPFLSIEDEEAISIVSQMVTSQNDPVIVMSLNDLRLDRIGEFYPCADFPLNGHKAVTVLEDLHVTLPLPPLVKEKVDELYKAKEKEVENE